LPLAESEFVLGRGYYRAEVRRERCMGVTAVTALGKSTGRLFLRKKKRQKTKVRRYGGHRQVGGGGRGTREERNREKRGGGRTKFRWSNHVFSSHCRWESFLQKVVREEKSCLLESCELSR